MLSPYFLVSSPFLRQNIRFLAVWKPLGLAMCFVTEAPLNPDGRSEVTEMSKRPLP